LKKYEVTLLLDDRKNEDGGAAFIKDVDAQLVKLTGKLVESTGMGRRQVVAPIRKRHSAVYWNLIVELPGDGINHLRDHYRLDERLLRFQAHLYTKPDKVVLLPRRKAGEDEPVPAAVVEAEADRA